jgi:hypothetical protein
MNILSGRSTTRVVRRNQWLSVGEANSTDWFGSNVKAYSLPKEGGLALDWLQAAVICIVYEDMYGRRYLSVAVGDETINADINSFLNEAAGKIEFNERSVLEWLSRPQETILKARARKQTGSSTTGGQTTMPPST